MKFKIIFPLLALLLLAGCQQRSDQDILAFKWPAIKKDTSRVYIFRESHYQGSAVNFSVMLEENVVGTCRSGGYFYLDLPPGNHILWAKSDITNKTKCLVTTEAGKEYFVEGTIGFGLLVGRGELAVADANRAKSLIPTLKYTPYTPVNTK